LPICGVFERANETNLAALKDLMSSVVLEDPERAVGPVIAGDAEASAGLDKHVLFAHGVSPTNRRGRGSWRGNHASADDGDKETNEQKTWD
jgi:hypothetical protein